MKGRAMLEEQIQKIIELRHDAPYAILGPHYLKQERALVIRAFLPWAERAYVLPAGGAGKREMQRLHPDGLFAIRIPGITELEYQLVAVDASGQSTTFHDPYAIHDPSFTPADGQALQRSTLDPEQKKVMDNFFTDRPMRRMMRGAGAPPAPPAQ